MDRKRRDSRSREPDIPGGKRWLLGGYVRISREDGDKDESDSIVNQRRLIQDYVGRDHALELTGLYEDDGYTGTNFERPGFLRMMDDIRQGKVNGVIVKDLSRLGRNYIEVGNYLEQVFPLLDVRFIAINDGLDSVENPAQMNNLLVPFKNLMNDEYCRDISNKIRSVFAMKRRRGEFIGAFAPYGYQRDPDDRHHLVIDEPAAEVVRSIFDWYIEGMSKRGIAFRLNELGVPNPSSYKKANGSNYRRSVASTTLWACTTITGILKNPVYTGRLLQGKSTLKSYKVKMPIRLPEEQWTVTEAAHDPIIDAQTFEKAAALQSRGTRTPPQGRTVHLFSGLVRCPDCGGALVRKGAEPYTYLACRTYRESSKSACAQHSIRIARLEEAVLQSIRRQAEVALSAAEMIERLKALPRKSLSGVRLEENRERRKEELERIRRLKKGLYTDWKNGDLTREEYKEMKDEYEGQAARLNAAINRIGQELEAEAENLSGLSGALERIVRYGEIERLTRELLTELVDVIYVYEGGRIAILFRYRDVFFQAARRLGDGVLPEELL